MLNFTQNTYYIKADELNMVIVLLKNSNYYCVNEVTDLPKSYKQHTYNKLEDVLSQLKESGNKFIQTSYMVYHQLNHYYKN